MELLIILSCLIPFLCVGSAYIIYQQSNRRGTIGGVRNNLIDDLTSLEMGYYYKNELVETDIRALIIELCNKGYIKIQEEYDKELLLGTFHYRFIKCKEYTGINCVEACCMNELFSEGNEVTTERWALHISRIKHKVQELLVGEKKDDKKQLTKQDSIILLAIASFGVTLLTTMVYTQAALDQVLVNLIWITVFFGLGIKGITMRGTTIKKALFGAFMIISVLACIGYVILSILISPYFIAVIIIGGICIVIITLYAKNILIGSDENCCRIEQLENYRKKLKDMGFNDSKNSKDVGPLLYESDKVYEVLPYVYVLEVVGKGWINRFVETCYKVPSWFICSCKRSNNKSFSEFMITFLGYESGNRDRNSLDYRLSENIERFLE